MSGVLSLAAIAIPWLGAVFILLSGDQRARQVNFLAVGFSTITGAASLSLFTQTTSVAALRIPLGGIFGDFLLVPDGLGVLIAVIASVIGCLAVVFATDYMRHSPQQHARFYALILFFVGAMNGLGLSGSLLFTFFFWEITALCSYLLISFNNDDPHAVAGGIKALVMTQFGGIGLLAAALMMFNHQGNYEIGQFLASSNSIPQASLTILAFGILIAAAAKSAQIPFHSWLPDAMEAPTPVTALIHAATMVNAGVYLLSRFFPAFEAVPGWRMTVMLTGSLSALIAGWLAVTAGDVKRVLAYSTISQLGFMVYGVGAGAIFAVQFHLLSHAIFKALLFLAAGALITALETRELNKMGGLRRKMPFVMAVFLAGSFGLVGLPFSNGFFSKDLILSSGLAGGPGWLHAGMIVSVGFTALYSMRLFWLIFMDQRRGRDPQHDGQPAMRLSLTLLAIFTFTSWLLVGMLSRILSSTLPEHSIEVLALQDLINETFTHGWTWITLLVIAGGFLSWFLLRKMLRREHQVFEIVEKGFSLDWLTRGIIQLLQDVTRKISHLQTGQLTWNILGLLVGLVAVLFVLLGGG